MPRQERRVYTPSHENAQHWERKVHAGSGGIVVCERLCQIVMKMGTCQGMVEEHEQIAKGEKLVEG